VTGVIIALLMVIGIQVFCHVLFVDDIVQCCLTVSVWLRSVVVVRRRFLWNV